MLIGDIIARTTVAYRFGFDVDGNIGMFHLINYLHGIKELDSQMKEIYAAQHRGDYLLIADLIENEIAPWLKKHTDYNRTDIAIPTVSGEQQR